MHEGAPTAEVAGFLRRAASAFPDDTPAPGPELALLMSGCAPAAAVPTPSPIPTRRPSMVRTVLSTLPGKLAAMSSPHPRFARAQPGRRADDLVLP